MLCRNCDGYINKGEQFTSCSSCNTTLHEDCVFHCVQCNNILCDVCAKQQKYKCKECYNIQHYSMEFISSTMFESYLKCPNLFKHEFVINTLSEADKQNKYSVVGSMLHALFDKYSQIRPLDGDVDAEMVTEYSKEFDKININLFDSEEDFWSTKATHLDTIRNWFRDEQNKPIPLFTEQQLFVELHPALPKIRVTLDRINGVMNNPNEWEVEDYKTGKVYSSDKLTNNMQFPIYAMALRHLYGSSPKVMRFIFPQHTDANGNVKTREFERVTDDVYVCSVKRGGTYSISLTERLQQMVNIYSEIKRGDFKFNVSDDHFCSNFCPLGKTGQCNGLSTKWKIRSERGY